MTRHAFCTLVLAGVALAGCDRKAAQPAADADRGGATKVAVAGSALPATRPATADSGQPAAATTPPPEPAPAAVPAVAAAPEPAPVAAPPAPVRADRPRSGCAAAGDLAERLVCGSPTLRARDREMAAVYRTALGESSEYGRASVRDEQRQWLRERARCRDTRCLARVYDERIGALHAE